MSSRDSSADTDSAMASHDAGPSRRRGIGPDPTTGRVQVSHHHGQTPQRRRRLIHVGRGDHQMDGGCMAGRAADPSLG